MNALSELVHKRQDVENIEILRQHSDLYVHMQLFLPKHHLVFPNPASVYNINILGDILREKKEIKKVQAKLNYCTFRFRLE